MSNGSFVRGGKETRCAKDFGGNHLARLRETAPSAGVFLDIAFKKCTSCGHRKPKKGGTNPAKKGWKCADCKVLHG